MARILTAGNETGVYQGDGLDVYVGAVTTTRNQTFSAYSPQGNTGRYSFYLTNNTGLAYDFEPDYPSGIGEFYVRFHMYCGGRADGSWEALDFTTNTGTTMLRFGTIDCASGGTNGGTFYPAFWPATGSTALTSNSSFCYRNNVWNTVEMYIKFAGSGGRIILWMNNQKVIDYTEALTGPGAETVMHRFRPTYAQISGGGASSRYYDDIAINDTTGTHNNGRIGEGYILPVWPAGSGSTTQLTNTFNTSTDNFKFINKTADNNPSGIVGTSTAGDKDLYALQTLPNEFLGVNTIRVEVKGVRNGAAITKAKMLLKPPAQAEIENPAGSGVGIDLPAGTLDYFFADFNDNANTGQPFTKAELDGMEAGIQFIA